MDTKRQMMRVQRVSFPYDTEFEIKLIQGAELVIPRVGQTVNGDPYMYLVERWDPAPAGNAGGSPVKG